MWLDWDAALATLGHDDEVKATYLSFIETPLFRPDVFIDIGANYGIHSLLFLIHGIETLSIEPNDACQEYFNEATALNNLRPTIKSVALGNSDGEIELLYPERDIWLGTTNPEGKEAIAGNKNLISKKVKLTKLDNVISSVAGKRILIKIDAERHELEILQGGDSTLKKNRPAIIFESMNNPDREKLYSLFSTSNYQIYTLPHKAGSHSSPLSSSKFFSHTNHNFIAIPNDFK